MKENVIKEDHGEWLEIDVSTPKFPCAVMAVDKEDWLFFKTLGFGRVYAARGAKNRTLYAKANKKRTPHYFHRLIMPSATVVDHVDRFGLNNRKTNMRSCSHAQNLRNAGTPKNNKTGATGVFKRKSTGNYEVTISKNRKRMFIGIFSDLEEAKKARKDAEAIYHGDFAYKGE